MKYACLLFITVFVCIGCKKDNPKKLIDNRQFEMGFTSWSFGPTLANVNESYNFITTNGDIYGEHMDHKIPWHEWMTGSELPIEFTESVANKVARKPNDIDLLLSISFLNGTRNDIMENIDGSVPVYTSLDDSLILDAYFKHVCYLVEAFDPTYLVYSIESNELFINSPTLWPAFRNLMEAIGDMLKEKYPNLAMAESVTLHNWYDTNIGGDYLAEVEKIANGGQFAAISFYPFFKALHSKADFQKAFDFLHSKTSLPIAFVETNHLAEDLIVDGLSLHIEGDEKEQEDYLETLFINAHKKQYEFIIWWAHRDYDALWETFPNEVKDLGKIWRDTGLKDEDGKDRKSMKLWRKIFIK